jgi:hypothetical protein
MSKTRRRQRAFADHLRRLGRRYPLDKHPRLVLLDNAPWPTGEPITQALAEYPLLALKRLPSLNPAAEPDRALREVAAAARHP